MSKFNLIVAEGHWNSYRNHSVKALFDLLSDLLRSNNHSYKYCQFANSAAFGSNLDQLLEEAYKYLYIGSHGYVEGIYGTDSSDALTFTKIKNKISNIRGLYLGTCLFGRAETLSKFVENSELTWCAGYKNSIDWIDSSALDLAFWKIFQGYNTQKGKKVEVTMIDCTLRDLRAKYSSLILDLGFNVAIRRKTSAKKSIVELAF